MDPLSIAAGVAGLGTLAYQIIGYLGQVKAGGKERQALREEVRHLWLTITALQDLLSLDAIKNDQIPDALRPLFEPDGIVKEVIAQMEELDSKLKTQTSHGKVAQTIAWPFTQKDAMQIIQRINRLQSTLHNGFTQANYRVTQDIYHQGQDVKKAMDEARLKELIEWVSPLNFVAKQSMIWKQHHHGTCKWFLEREDFRAWREGDNTTVFCPGIPGAGKTFLSSIVYNELEGLRVREEGGLQGAAVMMLYCKWDDPLSQSIDNLLSSMIKQCVQRYGAVGKHLLDLFDRHNKEGTRPSQTQLASTLALLFRRFTKVFVILDGLDELREEKDRLSLIQVLHKQWQDTVPVNLMVTSRPLPNIARHFRPNVNTMIVCDACNKQDLPVQYHCAECESQLDTSFDQCEACYQHGKRCGNRGHSLYFQVNSRIIPIAAVEEDLTTYVKWRTATSVFLQECVDKKDGLMERILATVVRDNGGMFLLAKFNMDTLESKLSVKQLLHALRTLPKELDGTYTDAMLRITGIDDSAKDIVLLFLRWVVFAEQPLHERAIEHALAVSNGDCDGDIDDDGLIRARRLATKCAGLVQFDESDCLRLVHYSAESYFSQHHERWFPGGSPRLTSACLTYLQFDPFKTGACNGPSEAADFEERLEKYPFLRYASMSWGKHLKSAPNDELNALAISFLTDPGCLASATQALWYLENQNAASWDARNGSPIHLAAHFDLPDLVEELIKRGYNADLKDINGATPLALATLRGNYNIASILLKAGVSVNTVDNSGRTPLHRAIVYNKPDILKLLLEQKGIDINTGHPKWSHLTPLLIAAAIGRVEAIELLIARPDLDVNKECSSPKGTTALIYAARRGESDAVKALLAHPDVDINHTDDAGNTALTFAAQGGYYDAVEALLDKGADTEVQQVDFQGTAIMRAIDHNQVSVVKLLIERGANLHHTDIFDRGVLHSAAVNHRPEILRILMAHDETLDVNMRDAHGKTTLHDIARIGDTETAEVLLAHGGDPTIKDNHGRTPIRVAREMNFPIILELFRAAGAQKKAKAHAEGRTNSHPQRTSTGSIIPGAGRSDTAMSGPGALPIWSLARSEQLDELKEILPHASREEINLTDPDMGQAGLHYAVARSTMEILRLLVSHGADVNLQNRYGRTPLHCAVMARCWVAAEILLDAGADMAIKDQWGHQPLVMATAVEKSVGLLLIERGAPLGRDIINLEKFLYLAARGGYETAARRLVAAGADVWRKGFEGKTAYTIAKENNHDELAKLILQLAPRPSVTEWEGGGSTGSDSSNQSTSSTSDSESLREKVSKQESVSVTEKEELNGSVQTASVESLAVKGADIKGGNFLFGRHSYTLFLILVFIMVTALARLY
ncbi:ankyrin repeat-containing domain protein [Aspergillus lucknowensis]|uniref:Ankyrin repeat-containing domain protein n=1 Tax=Aspergillus lucknowensis TaxID=176173 RepID=A0ABR4LYP6_9EURO